METAIDAIRDDNYKVELEVFSGPLDLLLYLIRKEEVDIYDIPISRITKQYLKYMGMIKSLNLEIAGEFILMAATLIRIKTRLLLPRDENDTEEEDPREELIMALVEYKKYKEAGEILREKALDEERKFVPQSTVASIEGRVDLLPATTVFDMLMAFREVMSAKRDESFHEVGAEEASIEDRMKVVLEYLAERQFATFRELFADIPHKVVAVVTFIALLELARTRRLRLMQSFPFTELRIYRGDHFKREVPSINELNVPELIAAVTE